MDWLIILYLVLFSFGKLTGFLPDLIVFGIGVFYLLKFKPSIKLSPFFCVLIFSLTFSLGFLSPVQIFPGLLYLGRVAAYFLLSKIIQMRFGKTKTKREFIFNNLIAVGIFIALFGWVQYFFFPDLRALKVFNWDDHYFRLVSTFLDPAFTGILLVLTQVLLISKTIKKVTSLNLILNILLITTILFTYSRASFLALFFVFVFFILKYRKKFLFFLATFFILAIFVLPKPGGQGVNLKRTYSITDRFINYESSISLIKKQPLFGVGFNNICVVTSSDFSSHSCSGLDNSILFVLATTGIVGFIIFIQFVYRIIIKTKFDYIGWVLLPSLIAIFVHGMFSETFFYNFILGWLAILIGITRNKFVTKAS